MFGDAYRVYLKTGLLFLLKKNQKLHKMYKWGDQFYKANGPP